VIRRAVVLLVLAWLCWREYGAQQQIQSLSDAVISLAGSVMSTLELYELQDKRIKALEGGQKGGLVEHVPMRTPPKEVRWSL
jgi:hypothetical protein